MNFGSGGNTEAKAWKDIWGSGQGIGAIDRRMSAAEYIAQLKREYEETRGRMTMASAPYVAGVHTAKAGT
jgi:nitronate monooxygenase